MKQKLIPIMAIVMTAAAAWLAYSYSRDEKMLKSLKAGGATPAGFTEAQQKHWEKL